MKVSMTPNIDVTQEPNTENSVDRNINASTPKAALDSYAGTTETAQVSNANEINAFDQLRAVFETDPESGMNPTILTVDAILADAKEKGLKFGLKEYKQIEKLYKDAQAQIGATVIKLEELKRSYPYMAPQIEELETKCRKTLASIEGKDGSGGELSYIRAKISAFDNIDREAIDALHNYGMEYETWRAALDAVEQDLPVADGTDPKLYTYWKDGVQVTEEASYANRPDPVNGKWGRYLFNDGTAQVANLDVYGAEREVIYKGKTYKINGLIDNNGNELRFDPATGIPRGIVDPNVGKENLISKDGLTLLREDQIPGEVDIGKNEFVLQVNNNDIARDGNGILDTAIALFYNESLGFDKDGNAIGLEQRGSEVWQGKIPEGANPSDYTFKRITQINIRNAANPINGGNGTDIIVEFIDEDSAYLPCMTLRITGTRDKTADLFSMSLIEGEDRLSAISIDAYKMAGNGIHMVDSTVVDELTGQYDIEVPTGSREEDKKAQEAFRKSIAKFTNTDDLGIIVEAKNNAVALKGSDRGNNLLLGAHLDEEMKMDYQMETITDDMMPVGYTNVLWGGQGFNGALIDNGNLIGTGMGLVTSKESDDDNFEINVCNRHYSTYVDIKTLQGTVDIGNQMEEDDPDGIAWANGKFDDFYRFKETANVHAYNPFEADLYGKEIDIPEDPYDAENYSPGGPAGGSVAHMMGIKDPPPISEGTLDEVDPSDYAGVQFASFDIIKDLAQTQFDATLEIINNRKIDTAEESTFTRISEEGLAALNPYAGNAEDSMKEFWGAWGATFNSTYGNQENVILNNLFGENTGEMEIDDFIV